MDFDDLDSIMWGGGADTPCGADLAASSPEEAGMSWQEFQWRSTDKFLDADRKRRGIRAIGEKKRGEALQMYLSSIGRVSNGN